ncbi:MAG: putative nitrogen fixation protein NifT [Hyphomicrobium sp.]
MTGAESVAGNADEPPEIYAPPAFVPGQKVRAITAIRSDGTVPGQSRGTFIVEAGDVGYVTGIGEFLQRYYIYRVDFIDRGRFVGMRRHEIEVVRDKNIPKTTKNKEKTMKITIAKRGEELSAYMAKKDLEERIVATERPELWGGWIELANGWRLALPEMGDTTRLPVTVNAHRLDAVG